MAQFSMTLSVASIAAKVSPTDYLDGREFSKIPPVIQQNVLFRVSLECLLD
jgi:hypothetical protein